MKLVPKHKKPPVLSTRVSRALFDELGRVSDETMIGQSDIVREGVARVLAEFKRNGSIRFGKRKTA
jgi:hypothetical protein